jgi:hypothetical protein
LTSCEQADGGPRKSFKPGDLVASRYIHPSSVEQYLKGGLIRLATEEEAVDGSADNRTKTNHRFI